MILIHDKQASYSKDAKTYKKNGNTIETYETGAIVSESISTLKAERQGCLNTIEAMNVRIAEIDLMLASK